MLLENIKIDDFEKIYTILKNTFPTNELQPKARLYQAYQRKDFFGKKVEENGKIIALITGYQRKEYLFLEFFVVAPEKRGHGLGFEFLKTILRETKTPVYLEVEPPVDNLTNRRVGFYQRLGFNLNTYPYQMPCLQDGFGGSELLVMSYPNHILEAKFEPLKNDFYREIYRV